MRRMLALVTVLVCLAGVAIAEEEAAGPGISTSGTAVVTVAPDSVRLVLQLVVEAASHEQAKEKLAEADKGLRETLEGLDIEGLQIESGLFEVGIRMRHGRSGYGTGAFGARVGGGAAGGNPEPQEDEPEVHYGWRQVAVSVGGVGDVSLLADHADRIQQTLLQDAIARLEEILFFASPEVLAEAEREALQSAAKNAIANAQAIATAAGVTIQQYLQISGKPVSYCPDRGIPAGLATAGWPHSGAERFKGTHVVRCTVSLMALF